jgi:predicted metal-dependent hydrolase
MSEPPAKPALDSESLRALIKGLEEFNSGRFFECHDTLEEIWQGCRGPARNFLQGLIQISVGLYHLRNGNFIGGESQLSKGLSNLAGYGEEYIGVDLAFFRKDVSLWLKKIRSGEKLEGTLPDPPVLHFIAPGAGD